ncbi:MULTISPECIES: hypothetical protein [Paenibacillus sonchi group]|uniref:hypothetical protein n=1 Tax=Paenibacillus sonchi group TaxID=2044880 RepID=UPI0002F34E26|nr:MULTISPECIES: hypothetical protein [Paenibacillus sonchi group]
MQIGQHIDEMEYAGEWLDQRRGSFAAVAAMAVRTLKTGRRKADFGVRGNPAGGAR